jgi:hypothetical protein
VLRTLHDNHQNLAAVGSPLAEASERRSDSRHIRDADETPPPAIIQTQPDNPHPRLVIESGEKSAAELSMAFHTTALSNHASVDVPAPRSPMTHAFDPSPIARCLVKSDVIPLAVQILSF